MVERMCRDSGRRVDLAAIPRPLASFCSVSGDLTACLLIWIFKDVELEVSGEWPIRADCVFHATVLGRRTCE